MFPIRKRTVLELGVLQDRPSDLVSVVISLHDYAHHIGECLESVAAQSHEAIEVVVVDDASTDASPSAAEAWLKACSARFTRVSLIVHEVNYGLAQTRNTGFEAAGAEHVFVLDADNALHPRALERLLETAVDTRAAVVFPQLEVFGEVDPQLGYADVWSRELFASGNYVDAMALVRKDAWAAVGGYIDLDVGWEDYDLWCRFVEAGLDGVFVPEILARYRVHSGSMLRTDTDRNAHRVRQRITYRHPWLRLAEPD